MSDDLQHIKDVIIAEAVKNRPDLEPQVRAEVETMASRPDLKAATCLHRLHSIWLINKDRRGDENRINSWTLVALGLTSKEPEEGAEFLPLRRCFARPSPPDIDSDFEDHRRDEMLDFAVERHGPGYVGNIGTYSGLHLRSAVRRISKTVDAAGAFFRGPEAYKKENAAYANEIMATLPENQGNKIIAEDEQGRKHEIKTVQDAYEYVPEFRHYLDQHPEILQHAKNIESLLSTFSVHASGVIVSDEPLAGLAPLRLGKVRKVINPETGEEEKVQSYATQFSGEDVEVVGLIKFDFLAIKMLSIIGECVRQIKSYYGIDIDIATIPLDDKKTFQLYQKGDLTGIFQAERPGMQRTLRDIGVDRFDDVIAAIALYRPGPMENIPEYIARKKNIHPITYAHPVIRDKAGKFLEDTYGIMVYQEQVMQVCGAVAGFSLTDGYGLVKAVSKKKESELNSYRSMFVSGANERGLPPQVSERFWDDTLVPFASYAFNKAHSCVYGFLSYITAFLKSNFPEEFMYASLNVEAQRKKWDKVEKLERALQRMNIALLPRTLKDENGCGLTYEIISRSDPKKGICSVMRPPLLCKGLSMAAAIELARNGPYENMRELATKTGWVVDTSSIEALSQAGFFGRRGSDAVETFDSIRRDLKKLSRKGLPSCDMFDE